MTLMEKYEMALDKVKTMCCSNSINFNVLYFMKFDLPTRKQHGDFSFLCHKNLCGQLDPDNYPEGLRCCHKYLNVQIEAKICTKAVLKNCFWRVPGDIYNYCFVYYKLFFKL